MAALLNILPQFPFHTVILIRNTSQIPEIKKLAEPFPKAELIPLVHDLNGISTHEVQEVLSHGGGALEWVIWAAGAKAKYSTAPTGSAKTEVDTMLVEGAWAHGKGLAQKGGLNVGVDDSEEEYFSALSVRPGELRDTPATRKCDLGKTRNAMEPLSRQNLANVVVELCEARPSEERGGGLGCRWLDVTRGGEDIKQAVNRCIEEDVDTSAIGGMG
ncbi:hypothetical protein EV426DRAFT_708668 [Tirmania nivea]|nr:hypothetical protein EV426DRAFT_708668 [Tirmania nivea]